MLNVVSHGVDEGAEARPPQVASELAAVLRALPDLYFVLDREHRFLDYSAGRSSDLYRPPEEFLGQRFESILPPQVSAGMTEAMERAHAKDEVTTCEYALEVDNQQQWFEVRFAPLSGQRTVALVRNVTERRLAAEELRLREERLRQAEKLEALGRVAGSIAHDFNNVLTLLSTSCTLVARELPDGHPARAHVASAKEALRSATDLTKHLLSFARRESIGVDVLDLDEVIDGMEFILRGMALPPVVLLRERSVHALRVRAARVQLEQVLMNLVVNSVDAMPSGGSITLRTRRLKEDACLEVVDTGLGMPSEVVEQALRPFFTTKPGDKGSGLGLATVDRVARMSGGSVEIDSVVGLGTTLRVLLPLAQ